MLSQLPSKLSALSSVTFVLSGVGEAGEDFCSDFSLDVGDDLDIDFKVEGSGAHPLKAAQVTNVLVKSMVLKVR